MTFRIESKIAEEAEISSELSPQLPGYRETQKPPMQQLVDYSKASEAMVNSKSKQDGQDIINSADTDIYCLHDEDETKVEVNEKTTTILHQNNETLHHLDKNRNILSSTNTDRLNVINANIVKNNNSKNDDSGAKENVGSRVNNNKKHPQTEDKRSFGIQRNRSIQLSIDMNTINQDRPRYGKKGISNMISTGYVPTYKESKNNQNGNGGSNNGYDNSQYKGHSNNSNNSYNNKQFSNSMENGSLNNNNGKGTSPPKSILPEKNASLIEWNGLRFLIMDSPKDSNLELYIRTAQYYNVTDMVRVCEKMYDKRDVEAAGIRVHEMSYDDGDFAPTEISDRFLNLVEEIFFKSNPRLNSQSTWNTVMSLSGYSSSQRNKDPSPNNAILSSHSSANSTPLSHLSSRSMNSHSLTSNNSSSGMILTNGSTGNYTVSTSSANGFSPPSYRAGGSLRSDPSSVTQRPCIAVHCVAGLGRAPVLVSLALIEYGFGDADRVVDFVRKRRKNAINMRQLQNIQDYRKRGHAKGCVCTIM